MSLGAFATPLAPFKSNKQAQWITLAPLFVVLLNTLAIGVNILAFGG